MLSCMNADYEAWIALGRLYDEIFQTSVMSGAVPRYHRDD